ncbi:MAG: hypothetical protein NT033_07635, partial [Candidatus Omnitrophica bacterium]|nr:hypothetical protein [Candidatus Omnitrophota bacterium]
VEVHRAEAAEIFNKLGIELKMVYVKGLKEPHVALFDPRTKKIIDFTYQVEYPDTAVLDFGDKQVTYADYKRAPVVGVGYKPEAVYQEQMGQYLYDTNQVDKAIICAQKAFALDPRVQGLGGLFNNIGNTLGQKGQFKKAQQFYALAAEAYLNQGDPAKASQAAGLAAFLKDNAGYVSVDAKGNYLASRSGIAIGKRETVQATSSYIDPALNVMTNSLPPGAKLDVTNGNLSVKITYRSSGFTQECALQNVITTPDGKRVLVISAVGQRLSTHLHPEARAGDSDVVTPAAMCFVDENGVKLETTHIVDKDGRSFEILENGMLKVTNIVGVIQRETVYRPDGSIDPEQSKWKEIHASLSDGRPITSEMNIIGEIDGVYIDNKGRAWDLAQGKRVALSDTVDKSTQAYVNLLKAFAEKAHCRYILPQIDAAHNDPAQLDAIAGNIVNRWVESRQKRLAIAQQVEREAQGSEERQKAVQMRVAVEAELKTAEQLASILTDNPSLPINVALAEALTATVAYASQKLEVMGDSKKFRMEKAALLAIENNFISQYASALGVTTQSAGLAQAISALNYAVLYRDVGSKARHGENTVFASILQKGGISSNNIAAVANLIAKNKIASAYAYAIPAMMAFTAREGLEGSQEWWGPWRWAYKFGYAHPNMNQYETVGGAVLMVGELL